MPAATLVSRRSLPAEPNDTVFGALAIEPEPIATEFAAVALASVRTPRSSRRSHTAPSPNAAPPFEAVAWRRPPIEPVAVAPVPIAIALTPVDDALKPIAIAPDCVACALLPIAMALAPEAVAGAPEPLTSRIGRTRDAGDSGVERRDVAGVGRDLAGQRCCATCWLVAWSWRR